MSRFGVAFLAALTLLPSRAVAVDLPRTGVYVKVAPFAPAQALLPQGTYHDELTIRGGAADPSWENGILLVGVDAKAERATYVLLPQREATPTPASDDVSASLPIAWGIDGESVRNAAPAFLGSDRIGWYAVVRSYPGWLADGVTQRRQLDISVSGYQLRESRPWISALRVKEKACFRANPLPDDKPYGYVVPGDYVMVLADSTDEWLHGDYVATNGKVTSGWLKRDRMPVAEWVPQTVTTDRFRFELDCRGTDEYGKPLPADATEDGRFEYFGLRVRDRRSGRVVQRLLGLSGQERGSCKDVVSVADWNFDGYPDVTLASHDGGAGPNYGFDFFFWNPRAEHFGYDAVFSAECQPNLDVAKREVSFAFRDGCCSHASKVYRVVNGTLRLVKEWQLRTDTNDPNYEVESSRTFENGKWRERKRRFREKQTP